MVVALWLSLSSLPPKEAIEALVVTAMSFFWSGSIDSDGILCVCVFLEGWSGEEESNGKETAVLYHNVRAVGCGDSP